jgi:hypothetical protein
MLLLLLLMWLFWSADGYSACFTSLSPSKE